MKQFLFLNWHWIVVGAVVLAEDGIARSPLHSNSTIQLLASWLRMIAASLAPKELRALAPKDQAPPTPLTAPDAPTAPTAPDVPSAPPVASMAIFVVSTFGLMLAGGCSSAHAAVSNPTMQQSCANYLAALTNATPTPTTTTTANANQWGDGSDGTVTLDGIADVPFATRSGTVYTLTRPVFFNSLTVNNGVTLNNGGYPIFGRGILTTIGTGTIRASYGASGGSSGASAALTNSLGGRGGSGGNGGAMGGAVTAADVAMLHAYSPSTFGSIIVRGVVSPVTGGSGGGSRGILSGGRGGGVLNIAFRTLTLASASSLIAPGAAGADSMGVDVAASGGGGGGGINLVYSKKNSVTFSPSTNCPGGPGGGGTDPGTAGQPGNIIEVVIQ